MQRNSDIQDLLSVDVDSMSTSIQKTEKRKNKKWKILTIVVVVYQLRK